MTNPPADTAVTPDPTPADADPTDAHPTDAHPTDAHPTDAHPTDAHPTDAHPTGVLPSEARPTDGGRPAAADAQGPTAFDLTGPLPTGTTVLEASAGTGKTYAIAALAARYVAAGVPIGAVLIATFGRMATDELRSRVRERLVDLEAHLAAAGAGRPRVDVDPVTHLIVADGQGVALTHARVAAALADFDSATVTTTHEFAGQMLAGLGVLGDAEPGARFVESLTDLTQEVATDAYLRRFAARAIPPQLGYDEAQKLADRVVEFGHTRLTPDLPAAIDPARGPQGWVDRVGFAHDVRDEVAHRKVRGQLYSYDDLLTRLQRALRDPDHGVVAARRLRERYRVVLIDEFQDTDPTQWDILQRAFVESLPGDDAGDDADADVAASSAPAHGRAEPVGPERALVLIGDPKQAIYAFRGADVFSYLDATRNAPVQTLDTNRRSDAALVRALDVLFDGAGLGPGITVRPVKAAHPDRRLHVPDPGRPETHDATTGAPIRLRVLGHDPDAERLPRVDTLRPTIVADLVADVQRVLSSGATLDLDDPTDVAPADDGALASDGRPASGGRLASGGRPVGPRDLAVLVHKNRTGEAICAALGAAGVPAVMIGAASVFASPTATDWLTLLRALERPRSALVRQVALTCFVGRDLAWLARADDDQLTELTQLVRTWSRVLARRGVAALVESVTSRTGLAGRLLAHPGGERQLTDLRHIGQLLHDAATRDQLGIAAQADWLRERMTEVGGTSVGERTRRLETEADAVSVLTVHRSKGLQFPIVYVPELWDRHVWSEDDGAVHQLHRRDPATSTTERVLDVGGLDAPGRRERYAAHLAEDAAEDLRLGYVALTRAECQVVTWWAPTKNTEHSALQRFLYAPRVPGQSHAGAEPSPHPVTGDPTSLAHLGDGFSVERVGSVTSVSPTVPTTTRPTVLDARTFTRTLDTHWRRTSYSGLTAAAHGIAPPATGVDSEPLGPEDDEQTSPDESAGGSADVTSPGSGDVGSGEAGSGEAGSGEAGSGDVGSAREGTVATGPVSTRTPTGFPTDDRVSPMAELPGGTGFGSTVHGVLERFDLDAVDGARELRAAVSAELDRGPSPELTVDTLTAGLWPSLTTPLGPLADDRALVDLRSADRLAELDFELPLAGGDQARAGGTPLTLADVADLLSAWLPTDDPLVRYPEQLRHPLLAEQTLRGYLTGSIDAVLRVGTAAEPRYVVVDYKTNVVGWTPEIESGERLLTVAGYRPDRLVAAMSGAHYPLQALLYAVALHRFLRWRQPGYDPERHLGGVLYLFLRGMVGPEPPRMHDIPYGVFSWRPPAGLVSALSDLLDRGSP